MLMLANVAEVMGGTFYGEKNIKLRGFRGRKKLAIPRSSQSGVTGCLAIMTGQGVPESLIDTLVDQNARSQGRASKRSFASSSAATADSRETVGNPSRKFSSVSPPSK